MKKLFPSVFLRLAVFTLIFHLSLTPARSATSVQEKNLTDTRPSSSSSFSESHPDEDGLHKAGRAVKKGAQATGRAIKKGALATGRAFKKAGRAVKDAFTEENSGSNKSVKDQKQEAEVSSK